jgi:hypothetical protein
MIMMVLRHAALVMELEKKENYCLKKRGVNNVYSKLGS